MTSENRSIVCTYWRNPTGGTWYTPPLYDKHSNRPDAKSWIRPYTPEYVSKLASMCKRHSDATFVCITNTEEEFENTDIVLRVGLDFPLTGWWLKLLAFKPNELFGKQTLVLDLDVLVLQNLDPLFDLLDNDQMVVTYLPHWDRTDPRSLSRAPEHARLPGWCWKYSSAVMAFRRDFGVEVWNRFKLEYMEMFRGDQDYIAYYFDNLGKIPRNWVCKERVCRWGRIPSSVKIVLCNPWKQTEMSNRSGYEWVRNVWC